MEAQGGLVRWSRIGLVAAAWLYAACIAIQVFLAGMSIGLLGQTPGHWADHKSFGQMIGVFPIVIVLFALLGRLPVLPIVLSVAIFVLYGLQYPFANSNTSSVAALHAVNALLMFWIATIVAQQGLRLVRTAAP